MPVCLNAIRTVRHSFALLGPYFRETGGSARHCRHPEDKQPDEPRRRTTDVTEKTQETTPGPDQKNSFATEMLGKDGFLRSFVNGWYCKPDVRAVVHES